MVKRPVGLKEGGPSPRTPDDQDDMDPQAKPQGPMAKWAPAVCLLVFGLVIAAVVVSNTSLTGEVDIPLDHGLNGSGSLRGAASDKSSAQDSEGASAKAGQANAPPGAAAQPQAVASGNPVAIFNTTMGSFTAEIYVDRVPISASNFVDLSKSGFYDGLYFHRVIPNFMAQFGDDSTRDRGKKGPKKGGGTTFRNLKTGAEEKRLPGGNIKDEHISKDSNKPGTLSMANTGELLRQGVGSSTWIVSVLAQWPLISPSTMQVEKLHTVIHKNITYQKHI